MATTCTHLDQVRDVTPSAEGCEECLAMGDRWIHLLSGGWRPARRRRSRWNPQPRRESRPS
jgi:hypothetical protein